MYGDRSTVVYPKTWVGRFYGFSSCTMYYFATNSETVSRYYSCNNENMNRTRFETMNDLPHKSVVEIRSIH